jgi:hypothetical protein
VVVASIGDHAVGSTARPANKAAYRGHGFEERDQLGNVVAVRAGEREGERDPCLVDEEMVLGAGTAPIDRARARFGAPFFACTWLESTIARDHSSSPMIVTGERALSWVVKDDVIRVQAHGSLDVVSGEGVDVVPK